MNCNIYQKIKHIGLSKKDIQDIFFYTLKLLKVKKGEASIHLIGDLQMRNVNKKYCNTNKTTDVLAFAIQEGKKMDDIDLGDIFVSIPQVRRQAKENSIQYKGELVRVIAHGVLHLNGYDHVTKKEEKEMFSIQERVVKKFIL